jgi:hypothetical protein
MISKMHKHDPWQPSLAENLVELEPPVAAHFAFLQMMSFSSLLQLQHLEHLRAPLDTFEPPFSKPCRLCFSQ